MFGRSGPGGGGNRAEELGLAATEPFAAAATCGRRLSASAHVPLPPYIRRADEPSDHERYPNDLCKAARIGCGSDGRIAFEAA